MTELIENPQGKVVKRKQLTGPTTRHLPRFGGTLQLSSGWSVTQADVHTRTAALPPQAAPVQCQPTLTVTHTYKAALTATTTDTLPAPTRTPLHQCHLGIQPDTIAVICKNAHQQVKSCPCCSLVCSAFPAC
jgi:hypothetical protein